ncbi:glycine cleavage H-protein [Sulfobacillus acidophilus TPY]|uniref:Glycine cleavage system H protein n=1 Tax=Sulfobacillus acidophilus (strain ATCC 700253 / DSM 10332 / NAL) TaxID=679936 RepID=G8TWI8_SULAD|nr:glycine cleavage H-protein [Sulfobacillus acidophilus TPY]AEW04886.1 Glycine cleavage system H protein [Sulfobacillus acidophilus DSM 10332]MCY0863945.1 glycine cleavage system protein GcvH [Sulfobacillus sp.]
MSEINGCRLPDDLYYWPDKHVWARPDHDGTIWVGMTDVAQSLAGKIVVVNLRSLGKTLARGKSAGTVESGKWVGSIATPVAGEVIAVNERLKSTPTLINDDPYGEGWMIHVRPTNWEVDRAELVTGENGIRQYQEKLSREGISCQH